MSDPSPTTEARLAAIWQTPPNATALNEVRAKLAPGSTDASIGPAAADASPSAASPALTAAEFYRYDAAAGRIETLFGEPVLQAAPQFFLAYRQALAAANDAATAGDAAATSEAAAAGDIAATDAALYRAGFEWGLGGMPAFAGRVQAEANLELARLPMGMLIERWWQPFAALGFGTWTHDFSQARHGLILVDLAQSILVAGPSDASTPTGRCECSLYAGLFAAFFSVLARRPLNGVEIACRAHVAERCQFVIATAKRIALAAELRRAGVPAAEIRSRLLNVPSAEGSRLAPPASASTSSGDDRRCSITASLLLALDQAAADLPMAAAGNLWRAIGAALADGVLEQMARPAEGEAAADLPAWPLAVFTDALIESLCRAGWGRLSIDYGSAANGVVVAALAPVAALEPTTALEPASALEPAVALFGNRRSVSIRLDLLAGLLGGIYALLSREPLAARVIAASATGAATPQIAIALDSRLARLDAVDPPFPSPADYLAALFATQG